MTIQEQCPLKEGVIVYTAQINIPKELDKVKNVQIILVTLEELLVESVKDNQPILKRLNDSNNPYEYLRKLGDNELYEIPLEKGAVLKDRTLQLILLYKLFYSPSQAIDYIKHEIDILKETA